MRVFVGRRILLLLSAVFAVNADDVIYPDDHWNYATRLTEDNFASTLTAEIDAGRTMMAYAGNDNVSFGDINLSEASIRGAPHNPGAGGWPTIRYFNKETGLEGASYEKKTSKSMCDELGDEDIMAAFVEDAAGIVSGCSLDGTGCDDRSLAFLNKWKDKKPQEINNELDRLMSLIESDMKHELKDWVKERRVILQRIVDQSEEVKTEL